MSPTALHETMDKVASIKAQLNGSVNGQVDDRNGSSQSTRPHTQTSYSSTGECDSVWPADCPAVEPNSFYGKLRKLYSSRVLKTQLEQMRKQGSYDAFKGDWHPAYDVRRLDGANTRVCLGRILRTVLTIRQTVSHLLCSGNRTWGNGTCLARSILTCQDRSRLLLPRFARFSKQRTRTRIRAMHSRIGGHD